MRFILLLMYTILAFIPILECLALYISILDRIVKLYEVSFRKFILQFCSHSVSFYAIIMNKSTIFFIHFVIEFKGSKGYFNLSLFIKYTLIHFYTVSIYTICHGTYLLFKSRDRCIWFVSHLNIRIIYFYCIPDKINR